LFVPCYADNDGRIRFFVGVQVDVTVATQQQQQGVPAGSIPAAMPIPPQVQEKDQQNAKLGHQAANMIGTALQGLNYAGANPWASIAGMVMRKKPHKSEDKVGGRGRDGDACMHACKIQEHHDGREE
jgi:hypothetical protein